MKKNIFTLIGMFAFVVSCFAQAPSAFKYQAVVRNSSNVILSNQGVGIQLTIIQGSISGTKVYKETFSPTTNAYGLVNLEIGKGTSTDVFTDIDWSKGPYFIETAIDVAGGTSYSVMGTSQFMSVPYAVHANNAQNSDSSKYSNVAANVINDKVDDADADASNEIQDLSLVNDTLKISNNNGATSINLKSYLDDTKLKESEVDAFVANNGFAKALSNITESVYSGSWSGGVGKGDTGVLGAIGARRTHHFDVVLIAHDLNSGTHRNSTHVEIAAYRTYTNPVAIQTLVTHYKVNVGGSNVDLTFGKNNNNELTFKIEQTSGISSSYYWRMYVKRIVPAN